MEANESREDAAKKLLREVVNKLLETHFRNASLSGGLQIASDAKGWLYLVGNGEGKPGWGDLSFTYKPRSLVLKLFEDCEKEFDALTLTCYSSNEDAVKQILLRDRVTTEWRDGAIYDAVSMGLLVGIGSLMRTMGVGLSGQYSDALMLTEGALRHIVYESFGGQTYEENGDKETVLDVERRVKTSIETRVKEIADRERDRLTQLLGTIPALITPTWRAGRPRGSVSLKPPEEIDRENAEHRSRILDAMCGIYRDTSAARNPFLAEDAITKKAIAERLNVSRTTLNEWLGRGQYDFSALKDEAIKMCSRN